MNTRLQLSLASLLLSIVAPVGVLSADDFESIFDGSTLAGWKAPNMSYWSVRDSAKTSSSSNCEQPSVLGFPDGST